MDPAMRGWMTPAKGSYLPPLRLGSIMRGGSVGQVIYSNSPRIKSGQYVNCLPDAVGWAQYGIAKDDLLVPIKIREGIPISAWAGVLGGTGLTAYFGLVDIGRPIQGDIVVVSAAAGAGRFCW
jgi:NADPH-dependent curcumin reductase CurA